MYYQLYKMETKSQGDFQTYLTGFLFQDYRHQLIKVHFQAHWNLLLYLYRAYRLY